MHAILCDIIVDLQPAVSQEPCQGPAPIDGVAKGRGQCGFGRQFGAGSFCQDKELLDQQSSVTPMRHVFIRRLERGFGFDGVYRCNPVQRLAGDGGFVMLTLNEEFPSAISRAGNFRDWSSPGPCFIIQYRKLGMGVGLQKAGKIGKMWGRMAAGAIGAVEIRAAGAASPQNGRSSRT